MNPDQLARSLAIEKKIDAARISLAAGQVEKGDATEEESTTRWRLYRKMALSNHSLSKREMNRLTKGVDETIVKQQDATDRYEALEWKLLKLIWEALHFEEKAGPPTRRSSRLAAARPVPVIRNGPSRSTATRRSPRIAARLIKWALISN